MLQPTSCGPGPPDKILEFNCNELRDNVNVCLVGEANIGQDYKISTAKDTTALAKFHNLAEVDDEKEEDEDAVGIVQAGGRVNDERNVARVCNQYVMSHNSSSNTTTTNTINHKNYNDNNNNCHLKKIKFYLNNTTAAAAEPPKAKVPTSFYSASASSTFSQRTANGAEGVTSCIGIMWPPSLSCWLQQCCSLATAAAATVGTNFERTWCGGSKFLSSSTSSLISTKWILMFLMLFGILAQSPHQVAAEKSKHYYMQSLCKNHFLQQLYRKIDGAVLWSQNERNLDCIITFQTHSILQRFMLRFDMLQLDCNDHLYVYDGAHAVATPKIDISCRQTKQTVSSILTRTNFVTLKYVTDNWGTDANGFKLVITSVKDPKHTCKDFTCGSNGFCIHPDLLCDGINHCSDNSDESVHNLCQNETTSTVFGMDMTWFVMIVVSILLILSAAIVGITICVCRRQEETNNQHNTAMQLHHTAETNGSSKHLHYTHGGTLSREHTQLPPTSGNWHHPAGPYGYLRTQLNYLKMATKVRPIWCLANFVN